MDCQRLIGLKLVSYLNEDSDEKLRRISLRTELISKFPRTRDSLLPALHYLQDTFDHLPGWALEIVGWHLGVPSSEVYGAASSYTELTLESPLQEEVVVCVGLSCQELGAQRLLDYISCLSKSEETSFVYKKVPCGFLCSVGPVVGKNGKWYGRVTKEAIGDLVQ